MQAARPRGAMLIDAKISVVRPSNCRPSGKTCR